tara:strand:+ start:543 stop:908 length:366 start_codon:yes stop_codon:yes gene_type:complete
MAEYLLFNEQNTAADVGETAHDVACYPISRFKGFTNTGTTNTELQMIFEGMEEGTADGDASSVDTITLTITANKQVEAIKAITAAISGHNSSTVAIIADALNSEYITSFVTGVSISISNQD